MTQNHWQQTWPAPAKLNLFLHILGRRADGYHELQTVFQLLDRGDQLRFVPRDDSQIQRISANNPVPSAQDLVVRAATALREYVGIKHGVDIHLQKNLPMGGGLGGGSSDAATTLLVLNRLWDLQLSNAELQQLALPLGADVPVFVAGHSAWAEGVGEKLTPMHLPEQWYLVVTPPCEVSTAAVFSHSALTRNTPAMKIAAFTPGMGHNDCQAVVCELAKEVQEVIDFLAQFGEAKMTGSGASVFLPCTSAAQAAEIAAKTPADWRTLVAKGVNTSPVLAMLEN